jgi:hypothetical protein
MSVELDVSDDFATILDGFEQIVVKRRDSAETILVPKAWRFSSQTEEAIVGVADVARGDVVWQFGWDESVDKPRIGDSIIDAANRCGTILSVAVLGAKTRLRCLARNLHLVHELNDWIEIQQAIWEDSGSGPEIVGWTTLRSVVPARIQLERTIVDNQSTPPTSTATFRVVLGEQIALDHNQRIVGSDGSVYQVTEYADAERIDTLPIATVVRLPSP